VLVRAGLEGVRAGLAAPPIVEGDPASMSEDERARLGLRRLPQTLDLALEALARDGVVSGWFTPAFLETYHGMKRQEIAMLEGLDPAAMLARYAEVY
jgi:glutamine synthetase